MSEFNDRFEKYLSTLEDPGLNVAQQLVRTAGKGGRTQNYHKPTVTVVNRTIKLFDALFAFDENPTDETFDKVKELLTTLELKAVRVAGSPEWIYITPDADPVKQRAKWDRISINTQFDLSWHVGSASKVGASDEHNGGDGSFRAVGEIVAQGDNFKLVMSNSRNRSTSPRINNRYYGDWAHSSATIDFPVMQYLAGKDFSIINVHGMASRSYGLLVNNRTSNFTKEFASLPTMIGIALSQYFNDSNDKKYVFGGNLPGSIVLNGVRKPLTAPNNEKTSPNSLYIRAKGVHNTNVIGNLIHNVNANKLHRNRYKFDSGKSCHIEFGIIRDGRPSLRKMAAAIDQAAYWMNNYKPELNPWQVVKNNPNFDMLKYGSLYPVDQKLNARLAAIATDENPTSSATLVKSAADLDEIDVNPKYDEQNDDALFLNPENDSVEEEVQDEVAAEAPKTLLLSGGPKPKVQKSQSPAANTNKKVKSAQAVK